MTDWINVARLEDIPRQGARVVITAVGEIALFRTIEDEVFALRDKCPHKGVCARKTQALTSVAPRTPSH